MAKTLNVNSLIINTNYEVIIHCADKKLIIFGIPCLHLIKCLFSYLGEPMLREGEK